MNREENIQLILRQLNGEATSDELIYFNEWLLENSANFDFFIEIKNIWDSSMTKEIEFDLEKAFGRIDKAVKRGNRKTQILQHCQQIAASILIIISLAVFVLFQTQEGLKQRVEENCIVRQIIKVSGAGEQLRLSLPDGTIVQLNAGSSIQFPERFEKEYREIVLNGEAFFDVTKDANHPFIVYSNGLQTTVLGTSFNIRAFKGKDISVTVARGKVKVEGVSTNKKFEVELLPNEQLVYYSDNKKNAINKVDAVNYLSWTNGILKFNNESLENVTSELERWFNVRINLDKVETKNLKVNGSFKGNNIYNILDGLCYMYNLEYELKNNTDISINQKNKPMLNY